MVDAFEYTKIRYYFRKEVICMSPTQQLLDCGNQVDVQKRHVREMVLESYHDIATGKGRDCNEFFDELEQRYTGVRV